jgi:hypothetical protein
VLESLVSAYRATKQRKQDTCPGQSNDLYNLALTTFREYVQHRNPKRGKIDLDKESTNKSLNIST